ncbi:MAG: choice-of-anchor D domain-containing protein [bacterium]|nr:choice-of-anchor D domain-containing protein [bacterium]
MWVKFDQLNVSTAGYGWRSLFTKSRYNESYGLMVYAPNKTLRMYHYGFGAHITDYVWSDLTADTWYHVAVTFDGTKATIYVDGVEVSSQTAASTSLTPNNNVLKIGLSGTDPYAFDGAMEEIRFWDVVRTETEINDNKDTELKGDESGLVLYYNFNEGEIGGDNTGISTIKDLTSQGNDGSLVGFGLTGSEGNFVSSGFNRIAAPYTDQLITFNALADKSYADADFALSASSSSGLPISSYTSSNTAVATVSGSTVSIVGVGTTNITAIQEGDATNRRAEAMQPLIVNKAVLDVRAQNTNVELNAGSLPSISFEYRGFANGDGVDGNTDISGLTGIANLNTIAATAPGIDYSSLGSSYDLEVNVGTASSTNYTFSADATKGQATIVDSPPVITLIGNANESVSFGSTYIDAGATAFDLIDGDVTASIVVNNPVNTSVKGNYTVTYDVMDSRGSSANQVTRSVEVTDPPILSVVDTLKVQVEPGKTTIANLSITNTGVGSLTWSAAANDTLGYGNSVTFNKANFASWQLAENQDRITNNVYITRGDNKSIFNARSETTSTNSISPADTEWSKTSANAALSFSPFVTMHGGSPGSLIGDTATIHLITDDEYHEVAFTSYSGGNSGGGFGYTRTPMYDFLSLTGTKSGDLANTVSNDIEITFDGTNLRSGLNYGTITLTSNDPANPTINVVTELEVLPSAIFGISDAIVGDTIAIDDAATTKTFKILNTGGSELSWSTSTAGRPISMNLVTLDAYSGTIVAGGEATITVTFDANTYGYYEWPITFATNDPSNPGPTMTISMWSSGTPGAVFASSSITLNDTYVGYFSTATLDIANGGNDTLFVYNAASDDASVSLLVDSLAILPFSGNHSLEFRFEPSSAGTVNGNLTFTTNDPTKVSNTIPFTGEALDPPVIDATPASISQTLTVNDTVSTQVTINNTGGSDLIWSLIPTLDAPIVFKGSTVNFVGSLGTKDNISSNVILKRQAIGAGTTEIYNEVEYPTAVNAKSTSTTIKWSPKSTTLSEESDYIDNIATIRSTLGSDFVGSTISLFIIAENRYFDLEILSHDAPSGPFANFSYNRTEVFPGIAATVLRDTTLATGSTMLDIEFYGGGLSDGAFNGKYSISSNDPQTPTLEFPISVTVSGGSSNISTTATTAATSSIVNQTSQFSLEVINTGDAELNISNVTVDDPAFGIGTTSFTVPVAGNYTLPLTFSPTLVQTYNATLSITSDDPTNSPFDIALTGTGQATADFQVASILIQDTLTAGQTNVKLLSVINNGAGDLEWSIDGEIAFEKVDYDNPNTESAQDRISDLVWLTRGDEKPVYNYKESVNYIKNHTSILFGNGKTFSQPTYGTFDATFNGSASDQVGNTTSLYMVEEDSYFDLAYSKWTESGDGGGFAYTRREAVPWLELANLSGTISGVGQTDINATFKTTNLSGGDYEFTYDVITNDASNPKQTVTFQLHVTGTPDINVTFASDSVRFGDVIIGQTTTLPVTVNNAGDSTLSVSGISFDNPAFSIDQTNFKVEAGKNVILNVSFTPTTVSTYKGGFTITSDDPDESPITFGVIGSGIEGPDLDLDKTTLNVTVVTGGIGSADLVLSNVGQQSLNWTVNSKYISNSQVFFEKPESADWTKEQYQDRITENVWITRRNDSKLFNIFERSNFGNMTSIGWANNKTVISGTLPSYDDDMSNAFSGSMSSLGGNTLSLHLTEENRYFDVYFNSWTSGNGNVGTGGFAYTRNEVATWLSVSEESGSIAVGGADQTMTVTLDAANLNAGTYTGELVLGSNGVEASQTVLVNLNVLGAPQLSVDNTLEFGDVFAGTSSTANLEITNSGNSTLNISSVSIDNPVFSVSNKPIAVEAGGTVQIAVDFNPSVIQLYAGTLTINSDDVANPAFNVSLTGSAISSPTAVLNKSELVASLFFGTSATQTFTIQNTGSADLEWSLGADQTETIFNKPDNADWTLAENQDRITDNVWLTRGNNADIFNIATESSDVGSTPGGTKWASTDAENTSFSDYKNLNNIPSTTGNIELLIGQTVSLYSEADQQYYNVVFSSYTSKNLTGGGFAYTRKAAIGPEYDAVTFSARQGVIPAGGSQQITVEFNPLGTTTGTFELPLQVVTNDPNNERLDIPLSLYINGIIINSTIADQLEDPEFTSSQIDISGMFTDAQGDALTVSVASSDASVVSVSESADLITITEVGTAGTAVISVTADDNKGTTETFDFDFQVNPYIWDGSVWNVGSSVPTNEDIRFDADYSVSGSVEAATTIVSSGATLTVGTGTLYTDNNNLNNEGTVVVESGGSLITNGQVIGSDYQIERITTFDQNTGRYSIVGSPVNNASFSVLGSKALVYGYDQAELYDPTGNQGLDRFKKPSTLGITELEVGRGYFSAFTGDVNGQVNFIGTPNTGTIDVSLDFTDHAASEETDFEGFNLISNPYPAAISYSSFISGNSGADINGSIYLWDDFDSQVSRGDNSDYLIVNTLGNTDSRSNGEAKWDGNIRTGQGFFVKANSATAVSFTNAMRVGSNNSDGGFYRVDNSEKKSIKLKLSDGKSSRAIVIGFVEDATLEMDNQYDALTLSGIDYAFYSVIGGKRLAINGLPLEYSDEIPLGISVEEEGQQTISMMDVDNPGTLEVVFLKDKLTGEMVNITEESYTFNVEAGETNDRFVLHAFPSVVTGSTSQLDQQVYSYSDDGNLYVIFKTDEIQDANFKILDLSGRMLLNQNSEINANRWQVATDKIPANIYILMIKTERGIWKQKVKVE